MRRKRRRLDDNFAAPTSYEASPARNERVLFAVSIAILFLGGVVLAAVWAWR
jgi:hypothetical protein